MSTNYAIRISLIGALTASIGGKKAHGNATIARRRPPPAPVVEAKPADTPEHSGSSWMGEGDLESSSLASRLASKPHLSASSTGSAAAPAVKLSDRTGQEYEIPTHVLTGESPPPPAPKAGAQSKPRQRSTGETIKPKIVIEYLTSGNAPNQTGGSRAERRGPKEPRNDSGQGETGRRPQRNSARRGGARGRGGSRFGANQRRSEDTESEAYVPPLPPSSPHFHATNLQNLFDLPIKPVSDKVQAMAQRVQLAMEHKGGDYSRLLPNSVAGEIAPVARAQATMGRRRDVGDRRRAGALQIVETMVGKQTQV